MILLFLALYALAGYFRDYFFVQINNMLYMKYYHTETHISIGRIMEPLYDLSYDDLYFSKYPFTLVWTCIYLFINFAAIKVFSVKRIAIKILFIGYALLVLCALVSMIYGYFVYNNWDKDEYTLSRWLMGIAQSPLPALILLASQKLSSGTDNKTLE